MRAGPEPGWKPGPSWATQQGLLLEREAPICVSPVLGASGDLRGTSLQVLAELGKVFRPALFCFPSSSFSPEGRASERLDLIFVPSSRLLGLALLSDCKRFKKEEVQGRS